MAGIGIGIGIARGSSLFPPVSVSCSNTSRLIWGCPPTFKFSATNSSRPQLGLTASSGPSNPTTNNSDSDSDSQDDWNYIVKLTVGSIGGAALIKYGSVVLPHITQPNIVQALLMISTPVLVALYLLLKGSRKQ